MINTLLKQLGFGDKESEVYLTILKHGKIAPADLAKATGINRTTVYSVAKELISKGVIAEDLGGTALYYVAAPIKDLGLIIKKEEKKLEEKKSLVDSAIKELAGLASQSKYFIPKIVFVAEEDLENYLYKQTPVWNESIMSRDGTYWGFQDSSFVRYYEKWIDWYWEAGNPPKELVLQLLSNEAAEKLKGKHFAKRKIKFWSKADKFNSAMFALGDYIVMIVTSQSPHYLVEIHDQTLAENLRLIFRGIWKEINK